MRTSLVLAAVLLFVSATAVAEESDGGDTPLLQLTFQEHGEPPRLFGHVPVTGMRAAAFSNSRLSLWAEQDSFAFGVDSPLHALEGGAAIRLLDDWRLTAVYRVRGRFSSAGSGGIDLGLAAPFVKLGMDF